MYNIFVIIYILYLDQNLSEPKLYDFHGFFTLDSSPFQGISPRPRSPVESARRRPCPSCGTWASKKTPWRRRAAAGQGLGMGFLRTSNKNGGWKWLKRVLQQKSTDMWHIYCICGFLWVIMDSCHQYHSTGVARSTSQHDSNFGHMWLLTQVDSTSTSHRKKKRHLHVATMIPKSFHGHWLSICHLDQ